MKITGGLHRGRTILSPRGRDIRPTPEKLREALFNILGGEVRGAGFVDIFAGTGAVGLEALSREAQPVVLVEKDRQALAVLRENLGAVDLLGNGRIVAGDAYRVNGRVGREGAPFRFIFADPPYPIVEPPEGRARFERAMEEYAAFLEESDEARLIVQHDARTVIAPGAPLKLVDSRRYGENTLTFFARW